MKKVMKADPWAFYVGKTIQEFLPNGEKGETECCSADMDRYIDRENQKITSSTGEISWDYRRGVMVNDAEKFGMIMGFLDAGREYRAGAFSLSSHCEYITACLIPYDDKPLCESESALLQVMTEDKLFGYKTNGTHITDVGHAPQNVRLIDGNIKLYTTRFNRIAVLDENGYVINENIIGDSAFTADGVISFTLLPDIIYYILYRDSLPSCFAGREAVQHNAEEYARRHSDDRSIADTGYFPFLPASSAFDYSPIDLRNLNEEYSGINGFVSAHDGDFYLGNGEKVRFWAVNAGPGEIDRPKEEIDRIARMLSKYGVNMVRMHGAIYDNEIGIDSVNHRYLDRYFYFISAMKKEGIYVKLSFYFPLWVRMKPEYGIPGYEGEFNGVFPFALLLFNERFQEIYKKWARAVFTTVNPYTGVTLANEPSVAIVEVQNEDNYLFWTFTRKNIPEVQMNLLEDIYTKWLSDKYGSIEKVYAAWGCERDESPARIRLYDIGEITFHTAENDPLHLRYHDEIEFLTTHQREFYKKMYAFYHELTGRNILVSASNWTTANEKLLNSLERYTYSVCDVIDRHGYFEEGHAGKDASWSVRAGHTYNDMSALINPDKNITKIYRVKGKPHIISETAWPMPNRFRGESVPMWTIFGSLQGMNAIFMFALGDTDWDNSTLMKWPLLVPSVLGQFPAFALMYRKGYITEGDEVVHTMQSLEDLYHLKGSPLYETQALDELRKLDIK